MTDWKSWHQMTPEEQDNYLTEVVIRLKSDYRDYPKVVQNMENVLRFHLNRKKADAAIGK